MTNQQWLEQKVLTPALPSLLALSVLLGVGLPHSAHAQAEPGATVVATPAAVLPEAAGVTAEMAAPAGPFTVGDPIELTLRVTHPAGTQVILPQLAQAWGDLEVRDQLPAQTTDGGNGTLTTVQTIVASLFTPGDFTTPPLVLTMSDASGQLSQALAAPVTLSVGSVLAEDDAELRDIKPQAEMEIPAAVPWPAIAAVGAAIILALLGFMFWRRRAQRLPVDKRTADQVAQDELARIAGLKLPAAGHYDQHYALTAECLRTYLERQFAIPALDRTTLEITTALRNGPIAPANAHTLVTLLAECDLVKFAKMTPGPAAANDLLEEARRFVTSTTADKNAAMSQASVPDTFVVEPAGV